MAPVLAATAGLKMVQSVLSAIRTADIQSGKALGGRNMGCVPEPEKHPRLHIHPTPRIESRPVVHPTPRFESRPVLHPTPKFNAPPAEPEHHQSKVPFVQAPWKMMPYPATKSSTTKIKIVLLRPDMIHKGSLLDFFC